MDVANIKIGIIGTGRIADRFMQELENVKKEFPVTVAAVYNPHTGSAEIFAGTHGIDLFTDDLEKFTEQIDAVYIASPHNTHVLYAEKMLEAGKDVLCEKPLALKKNDAIRLFQLAKRQNCVFMEAVKTAYCPGFLAMMEAAVSGKIGTVYDVEACFSRLTPTNVRELTDRETGGSFTEFGSYTLLPVIKLLGTEYQDIHFQTVKAENGVDAYTKAVIQYKNGMGLSKTGLEVKSEGQLVIAGTKGYILSESPWWLTKKFVIRYEDPGKIETYEFPFERTGLQYEMTAFFSRVQSKQSRGQASGGELTVQGTGDEKDREIENRLPENDTAENGRFGVTPEESIAFAGIFEKFLAEHRLKQEEKRQDTVAPAAERMKRVKIWAHRGCSMACPENTLEAFLAAAELPGITGIELDVQLTKDEELVVFHDENVKRVTDGDRDVRDYTLEELKKLSIDAGNGKTSVVPTLEEVFLLLEPYCRERGLLINIELKTGQYRYEGIEEKTLALVNKFGLEKYIVYSSFLPESVAHIKELDPTVKTGMLGAFLEDCIVNARRTQADALHPWFGGLFPAIPEDMKDFPVRAWGGAEPFFMDGRKIKEKDLREYAEFGVTDIITNVPERYLGKE